jgi:cell division protein FtsB
MRLRSSNTLHVSLPVPRGLLVAVAFTVALAWLAYQYAQEAVLSHRLQQEAAQLRHQNDEVTGQNDGYRRDIVATATGAQVDEEARSGGYARPEEKVYLIGDPADAPHPRAAAEGGLSGDAIGPRASAEAAQTG